MAMIRRLQKRHKLPKNLNYPLKRSISVKRYFMFLTPVHHVASRFLPRLACTNSKQKEVLFLRHKLQRGLLTREQEPKEEEMKSMSDYITKLEGFPDLEVSIIRITKINKVLKAILKLENIPKESEFNFKARSQVLLDQWNKLLSSEPTPTNGVNGTSAEGSEKKEATPANGVKEAGKKSKGGDKPSKVGEKEKSEDTVEDKVC
jgi:hypothetical protein